MALAQGPPHPDKVVEVVGSVDTPLWVAEEREGAQLRGEGRLREGGREGGREEGGRESENVVSSLSSFSSIFSISLMHSQTCCFLSQASASFV